MNAIIDFANAIFKPLIDMGAPTIMLVVLTIIALCFRVKFSKALEGGMKLAIALTAIGDVMNLLTTSFAPAMNQFVAQRHGEGTAAPSFRTADPFGDLRRDQIGRASCRERVLRLV